MTTQEKLVNRKLSIIELAEFLKNVSQTSRINGVSRQHFHDIKKAYDENGIEGLKQKSRRKPCIKNRVAPEIEENECLASLESLPLSVAEKETVYDENAGIFGVMARNYE